MGETVKKGIRVGDYVRTLSKEGVFVKRGWIITGKLYRVIKCDDMKSWYEIVDEVGDVIVNDMEVWDKRLGEEGGWEVLSFEENLKKIVE